MTPGDFRKMALALKGAEEKEHMHHPDFRVGGKIFATLGYPNAESAMVKLTPEQQDNYCRADAEGFRPVKGKWGLQGATNVLLPVTKKTLVKKALGEAHETVSQALTLVKSKDRSTRSRRSDG